MANVRNRECKVLFFFFFKLSNNTNLEPTGEEFQFGIKFFIIIKSLQSSKAFESYLPLLQEKKTE